MNDTSKVRARMNRTLPYSTVHGERAPGDPHAKVFFYQNGIPFDAEGFMLAELIDEKDTKLKALAERKQALAEKQAKSMPAPRVRAPDPDADPDAAPETDEDDDAGLPEVVNLEAWLRGEAQYPWQEISNRIGAQYARRVVSKKDAVEFLVNDQKIVPRGALSKELFKLLDAA